MDDELDEIPATGLSRGMNLFFTEQKTWWSTRRWWVQGLIWSLVAGGMTGLILFVSPGLSGSGGEVFVTSSPVREALGFVFGSLPSLLAGAVIVLFQGSLIQERTCGTAAWILSKPVKRRSYLLAKFFSGVIAIGIILLFIPLSLSWVLFLFSGEELFTIAGFIKAAAILFPFLIFHLSLTLYLGTVVKSEGAVGGGGIFLMLLFTVLGKLLPGLRPFIPWSLPGAALAVVNGYPLPVWMLVALASTILLTVTLLVGAMNRLHREEIRG